MTRRTVIVFWTAVAVAALLLGSAVSSVRAALQRPDAWSLVPLGLSVAGLAVALIVTIRVVLVLARTEREARTAGGSSASMRAPDDG